MAVKKDSFNRTGPKGGDRYVRLPTNKVDGAIFLKPGDKITLEEVNEEDIFPECEQPVVFDPNEEDSKYLVKDPATYEKEKKEHGDYGLVVFDPN